MLLFTVAAVGLSSVPGPRSPIVVLDTEPDIRKARPLPDWPTEQDLARLASAKGLSRPRVLALLGHPCAVELRADGVEVWAYPWVAACSVRFEKGVCTDTFYTGGY
jgi:hypothetical protein